ncbi:OmpA family protein [Lysobacter korlensis]|uniref:OmpA family protein n=1 Tax=Lysobacter korlensis TaxID=553636 RepID=A0ABV6RLY8_9GAMM
MKTIPALLALALAAGVMPGCKKHDEPVSPAATEAPTPVAAPTNPPEPAAAAAFDLARVPVSTALLGEFPYFGLPEGYKPMGQPEQRDFDRFPFWTGDRFEWVEGRIWSTFIGREPGKSMSQLEVARNIEQVVREAGGVKVFEGRVPKEAVDTLGDDIMVSQNTGIGGIASEPSIVHVVRRPDRTIWVYLNTYSAGGSLTIAETKPFVATAKLLPAAELKQEIDATGKVALQVNFATDSAQILPDSQPQVAQVAQLLKDDPKLSLAVNGHTDGSGDPAHNLELSEARAKAVVDAVTAQGVDGARLNAKGFGDTQPVADNSTSEGKARNRRVELVKQ